MLPELHYISRTRRALGLTQNELASKAGVSQSLIAKIESGKTDPAYSKAKSILDALDNLKMKEEKKAKDIMNKDVFFIKSTESVHSAALTMRKRGFSQMPVINQEEAIVGSISDKGILMSTSEPGNRNLSLILVEEIMEDPFPTVDESTPVSSLSALLKHSQGVLVLKGAKVCGIITKADFLKFL